MFIAFHTIYIISGLYLTDILRIRLPLCLFPIALMKLISI